ncbi:hypothetical protein BDK51DRAFT_33048 [Blyttiomyces helicus]|uniref:Uncharacterized protein n=1 Tax=Blyttiomyces helicus TaxID=388810 RepID=A0A4P9W0U8_9FUNG|nr:hypothetical protein BDK51DRAFT_33048 [Blyttiomyces helicus]|eukprot:RKO84308.1 hypothetical protein BDK51DRAFT_33048 [Blyttiomyces helicus]
MPIPDPPVASEKQTKKRAAPANSRAKRAGATTSSSLEAEEETGVKVKKEASTKVRKAADQKAARSPSPKSAKRSHPDDDDETPKPKSTKPRSRKSPLPSAASIEVDWEEAAPKKPKTVRKRSPSTQVDGEEDPPKKPRTVRSKSPSTQVVAADAKAQPTQSEVRTRVSSSSQAREVDERTEEDEVLRLLRENLSPPPSEQVSSVDAMDVEIARDLAALDDWQAIMRNQ